jgi:hypothetical protein
MNAILAPSLDHDGVPASSPRNTRGVPPMRGKAIILLRAGLLNQISDPSPVNPSAFTL